MASSESARENLAEIHGRDGAMRSSSPETDATELTSRLLGMIVGLGQTQVISLAAKLNIADRLRDEARTIEQLAHDTEVPLATFVRLMKTLVQMGLFEETVDKRYRCTPMGTLLQEDSPNSIRHVALLMAADFCYQTWPHLMTGLQTGDSVFRGESGAKAYSYLQENPEQSGLFQAAMGDLSRQEGIAIVDVHDFSGYRDIVDIGGGQGGLLAAILRRFPEPAGRLFDLPGVTTGARALLESDELKGRIEIVSGDFLEGVPSGGDLYILKRILMDRTDEDACVLLSNIKQAMEPNGRLLVFDADDRTLWGKLLDLMMLLNFAGRLRTEHDVIELLERAGFELVQAIDTGSPTGMRMYEAVPVAA
jgi:hypothetical protein